MADDDQRIPPGADSIRPPASAPRYSQRPRMSVSDEVGHAMLSLNKASRSFTLYDPHNDAVKILIGDYKDKSRVLARHAPLEVEVMPFEIALDRKVVYEERDRERSLAFRLFRDGVRKIRFAPGLGWDDLVSLLEVMSVRCNGVRQQEEDLITLLRKARFENIEIESVEGYIPDEEMPENQALAPMVDASESVDPPGDWDQPLPTPAGGKVAYQPIDPNALDALLAEEAPAALQAQAVRSVYELMQTAVTLQDPELLQQLVPFAEEVQHYLIVERNLDELARLATIYRDMFADGRSLPVLSEERAFERLMRMVTEEDEEVPPALYHLIGPVAADAVPRALDMLTFGARGARRKALIHIIQHGAKANPAILAERIGTVPPDVVSELFAALGRIAPNHRIEAAFSLLNHPDEDFQLELVDVVAQAPKGVRLARGLQTLMGSPHEAVRIKATQTLGTLGGTKAIPMLVEHGKNRARKEMGDLEAEALGTAIAVASVEDGTPVLLQWAGASSGIKSLLSKIRKDAPGDRPLVYAAVAGLELCPGRDAEAVIQQVLARSQDDPGLADRCQKALEARRGGGHA